jgi:alkylated DNA repair dioxygenase AlkB
MTVALSLFDDPLDASSGGELGIGRAALRTMRRTPLAHGAWVDHLPGWVRGSAAVYEALERDVTWRAERRQMYDRVVDVPRLVAWFGEGEALPHPVLDSARSALSVHYRPELGEDLVTAGLCFYRDGSDSVAWHGDTIGRSREEDTVVAIVSLGTARPLLLRPRAGGAGTRRRFLLGHGDLLVMGGSCQRTWEHAVPKARGVAGGRISVQFRVAGVR